MKTKLTLIALTILLAVFGGCSQDVNEGTTGILATVSVGGTNGGDGDCVTLWAGQNINAGTVCVSVIDDGADEQICITYNTIDGWELTETHIWVGDTYAGYPQTRKGNPKIGHFPYQSGDITGATTWELCIPLAEWGTELNDGSAEDLCGKILYIAAHAALQLNDGSGNIIQTETGWADGDDTEGNSWATFFSMELICSDDPEPPVVGECETAFAYGDLCFLDIEEDDFSRWGWTVGPICGPTEAGCVTGVDDFSVAGIGLGFNYEGYTPVAPGTSGSVTIIDAGGSILGGQRDVTLNKITGGDYTPYLASSTWHDGVVTYNSGFGDNSTWTLTYGLAGDLNADLTADAADRIRFMAYGQLDTNADGLPGDGTPLTVTVWSSAGFASKSLELAGVTSDAEVTVDLIFADFAGVDFTDVDKIVFEFTQDSTYNPAVDYGIGAICAYREGSPGTLETPIYAGAGQCDTSKGTLVGTLTIDYDGSTAVVTYLMDPGFTMDEVHLYVGNEILPWDNNIEDPGYTVAPGQYPYIDDALEGVSEYTFTVDGLSGCVYVVAHAVVCGDFPEEE